MKTLRKQQRLMLLYDRLETPPPPYFFTKADDVRIRDTQKMALRVAFWVDRHGGPKLTVFV